jgi:hypothetical protein
MSDAKPVDADPLIETVSPYAAEMDYPSHFKTYNRFIHLVKWFCIHMAFVLVALYCLIIAHQAVLGTVLLLVGILVLIYGIVRHPNVNRDLQAGFGDAQPAE